MRISACNNSTAQLTQNPKEELLARTFGADYAQKIARGEICGSSQQGSAFYQMPPSTGLIQLSPTATISESSAANGDRIFSISDFESGEGTWEISVGVEANITVVSPDGTPIDVDPLLEMHRISSQRVVNDAVKANTDCLATGRTQEQCDAAIGGLSTD